MLYLAVVSAVVVGVVSAAAALFLRRSKRKTAVFCKKDLTGKTVIVTGANTGIGYWTARDFAIRHARVILACRSEERAKAAQEKIVAETGNKNVVVRRLDLFDFNSVRKFSEQIHKEEDRLDILVNNAGLAGMPQQPSEHGIEVTIATNHFGPFLLTLLLIDLLKTSAPSRIVMVGSSAHNKSNAIIDFDHLDHHHYRDTYRTIDNTYATSKLATVLFTRELSRRLEGTGVTVNCVDPGFVTTEIYRFIPPLLLFLLSPMRWFFKTAEEGAQTSIYLALSDEVEGQSGQFYADCALAEDQMNPLAKDEQLAKKLWDVSAKLTGVSGDI